MSVRTAAVLALGALGAFGSVRVALAAPAAHVEFAIGNTTAINAAGISRALAKGAPVEAGDTIDTGSGRAQLRFSDGAYVSLQPNTRFRIDEYNYAGKSDDTERGFFSLLRGGLRTITGLVGRVNKRNYQVRVPVATIGIRGTEYTLAYDGTARGAVGEGEISVCNIAGCTYVSSGQAFVVANANSKPETTSVRSFLAAPPASAAAARQSSTDQSTGEADNTFRAGEVVDSSGQPISVQLAGTPGSTPQGGGPNPLQQPLFGDQRFPPNGPNVTTQNVTLSLTAANFPASLSLETSTLTRGTQADVENGKLVSWNDAGQGTPANTGGTTKVTNDWGNVGDIAWGRFSGGTLRNGTAQGGTPGAFAGRALSGSDSLHYVVAIPTPVGNLPVSGTVDYSTLVGATTPTTPTGTVQLVTTGAQHPFLSANFTLGLVNTGVSVIGPGGAQVNFAGSSVIAANRFGGGGSATGAGCGSNCGGDFSGVFAGPQGQYAGFTYAINNTTFGPVRGAIVLTH